MLEKSKLNRQQKTVGKAVLKIEEIKKVKENSVTVKKIK